MSTDCEKIEPFIKFLIGENKSGDTQCTTGRCHLILLTAFEKDNYKLYSYVSKLLTNKHICNTVIIDICKNSDNKSKIYEYVSLFTTCKQFNKNEMFNYACKYNHRMLLRAMINMFTKTELECLLPEVKFNVENKKELIYICLEEMSNK